MIHSLSQCSLPDEPSSDFRPIKSQSDRRRSRPEPVDLNLPRSVSRSKEIQAFGLNPKVTQYKQMMKTMRSLHSQRVTRL